MGKLCCHKRICHQNLSLISHLQMINKQAALPTVALCFVVQEIKAELIFFYQTKMVFLFLFIFYFTQSCFIFIIVHILCLLKVILILIFNFRYQNQRNGRTTTLFKVQKNTWRYFNAFMHSWFMSSMCCLKTEYWVKEKKDCWCKIFIKHQRVSNAKFVHNQHRLMSKVLLNLQKWFPNQLRKELLVGLSSKEQLVNLRSLNIVQIQEIYQCRDLITTVF